ncbi:MAG: phytanoyl-CoA dioxygenase family protein [Capsulimonadales bacterium]|nr:phytanoyl-CoA dioxygenase family protein [Capsulimonadales bacterium]
MSSISDPVEPTVTTTMTTVANEANAPAPKDRLDFFRENSYVVLPNLLSPDEVRAIHEAIDRDRSENPFLWWFQGNPNCGCNLLLTEPAVDVAFRPPAVLELLDALMGSEYVFEESAVQITEPSEVEKPTGWHRDRAHWPEHPYGLDYPQLIVYLTDVDETTHCFTLSPEVAGSEPVPLEEQLRRRGTVHFHGRAGTAIFFNCAIYHGLTMRKTPHQRRILQVYYGHPDREPINDATILPPRLRRNAPDERTRRFYGKPNRLTRVLLRSLGVSDGEE